MYPSHVRCIFEIERIRVRTDCVGTFARFLQNRYCRNPDFVAVYTRVTQWLLELDHNGLVIREVGLDCAGAPVVAAPLGINEGVWINRPSMDLALDIVPIDSREFHEAWSTLLVKYGGAIKPSIPDIICYRPPPEGIIGIWRTCDIETMNTDESIVFRSDGTGFYVLLNGVPLFAFTFIWQTVTEGMLSIQGVRDLEWFVSEGDLVWPRLDDDLDIPSRSSVVERQGTFNYASIGVMTRIHQRYDRSLETFLHIPLKTVARQGLSELFLKCEGSSDDQPDPSM